MKTDYATLSLNRKKGHGQRSVLKCYDKDGNLVKEHYGTKAHLTASTLRNNGVRVVMT